MPGKQDMCLKVRRTCHADVVPRLLIVAAYWEVFKYAFGFRVVIGTLEDGTFKEWANTRRASG